MINKKLLFFLTFSFIGLSCFSQKNTIDSLLTVVRTAKEDTNKVNALDRLSTQLWRTSNYEKAENYAEEALELSEKLNFKLGKANAYYNIATIHDHQGDFSEALKNYSASLKIYKEIGEKEGIADSYSGLGYVHYFLSNFAEALKNFFEALKIQEEIGDKLGITSSYTGIGVIYQFQNNLDESLKNYHAALKIYKEAGWKGGMASAYNNIGNVYQLQGKYQEAIENYLASLKIKEAQGNINAMPSSYGNIGSVYERQGNYSEALRYYFLALEINQKIGDKNGLAATYLNLGSVNTSLLQFSKAKKQLEDALKLSKEIGSKEWIKDSYNSLSVLDSIQGNWELAYKHHKLFLLYRDSIDNEESQKKTIQASMNYEFERKEALTKAEQDKKDAIAATEMKRQQIIRYAISGILVLVILFTLFLYNRFRLIRMQKNIIELKEKETQQQKEVIEEKHQEITDSINYAERIQRSFMATSEMLDKNLKDYFVFFRPKDVVSGDFYWAGELKDGNFAFSCADSTGHGVPGAIMSILNISSLEKSIEEETKPNKILNKTRRIIIERLKKDGSPDGGKDGMDCSLMVINKDRTQLSFAAANNPVFIVRNNELIEFKPDKMPVGKHDNENESFNLQTTTLLKGDIIYCLTDGFSDQFGGEKGKKYMIRSLKALLLQIAPLSMQEQEQKLAEEFATWKGENEQVDDVCIMGVRV